MKSAICYTLLAAFLGSVSALAAAGTARDEPPRRTVHFADLDLTRASGARALYQGIRSAAQAVCAPPIASDPYAAANSRPCVEAAIERAVSDVNAPLLTDYYRSTRRPPVLIVDRQAPGTL